MSSSPSDTVEIEPSGFFGSGKSRSAAELARSVAAIRSARPANARSRISAAKAPKAPKKTRVKPLGPTPERLAHGDVIKTAGLHVSIPVIQRLRDQGKLDVHARENEAMFQAAEKLRRHFDGCMIGVKAQDLNKIISATGDDVVGEEAWVQHRDQFRIACKVMGWFDHAPHRGNGRIVVAVVCEDAPVRDAARIHVGAGDTTALMGAAMDRVRQGLFVLAVHWRMC